MAASAKDCISPEEYLQRERCAAERSEYYRGEMFAMNGASRAHNLIVTNLVAALRNKLRGQPCEVYAHDMRVVVHPSGWYTYPDVIVVCGPPVFADEHVDTLTNPTVLIEVLSDSTADYDRGGKFQQARRIPSLQEYLTVSQTERQVEHATRQSDGNWLIREAGPEVGRVVLDTLSLELPLADIYERVELA